MMDYTIQISSTNYNGQFADIAFFPTTGGVIQLGELSVPFEYVSSNPNGTYELFFSAFSKTCTVVVDIPTDEYLLQEDLSFLLQEDGDKIIITM